MPVYHVAGQAHAKSVPLLPVLELLRAYFGITERDSEPVGARADRRQARCCSTSASREDLPLLFDFLAVPDPERPVPAHGSRGAPAPAARR